MLICGGFSFNSVIIWSLGVHLISEVSAFSFLFLLFFLQQVIIRNYHMFTITTKNQDRDMWFKDPVLIHRRETEKRYRALSGDAFMLQGLTLVARTHTHTYIQTPPALPSSLSLSSPLPRWLTVQLC